MYKRFILLLICLLLFGTSIPSTATPRWAEGTREAEIERTMNYILIGFTVIAIIVIIAKSSEDTHNNSDKDETEKANESNKREELWDCLRLTISNDILTKRVILDQEPIGDERLSFFPVVGIKKMANSDNPVMVGLSVKF